MPKIYKTPEAEKHYKRIFKETAKRFGYKIAYETMLQIKEAEEKLANGTAYAKRDASFYSDRFEFITIKNSQTIIFERINNSIVIVAAGWSGRNWKDRLEEMQAYIDHQIEKLKKLKNLS